MKTLQEALDVQRSIFIGSDIDSAAVVRHGEDTSPFQIWIPLPQDSEALMCLMTIVKENDLRMSIDEVGNAAARVTLQ